MESKDTGVQRRAIVIGGSMGGLIAARALSDNYAQVTIVERDELPAQPANRRGVPQGRHTHGLRDFQSKGVGARCELTREPQYNYLGPAGVAVLTKAPYPNPTRHDSSWRGCSARKARINGRSSAPPTPQPADST
jgi:predicted NAD/FAD-dependent oxidoreductase